MSGAYVSGSWPLVGNEAAVAQSIVAIQSDRVPQAVLVSGQHGVGKNAFVRMFAQALLCGNAIEPGRPCGVCLSCRKIDRGVHPDVQRFSLATQESARSGSKNTTVTIETVRSVTAQAGLRPLEGRWRFTILDDAEAMQETAQEALLKSLEEPPPFTVMMVLASDPEALLPTVRSRCQAVDLWPVASAKIETALGLRGVEPDRARELAMFAGGAPGWAINAIDDPAVLDRRRAALDRAWMWIDADSFRRLVTAVKLGDSFSKRRAEAFADLEMTLSLWRDVMLVAAGQSHYLTFRTRIAEIERWTTGWTLAGIQRALASVRTCLADLEANVRPRLALEAMVMQWPTR